MEFLDSVIIVHCSVSDMFIYAIKEITRKKEKTIESRTNMLVKHIMDQNAFNTSKQVQ